MPRFEDLITIKLVFFSFRIFIKVGNTFAQHHTSAMSFSIKEGDGQDARVAEEKCILIIMITVHIHAVFMCNTIQLYFILEVEYIL